MFNTGSFLKKKLLILVSAIFVYGFFVLSAENYRISEINYDIQRSGPAFLGTTQKYALEQNVPVDTDRVFESQEELDEYVLDYVIRLNNTRFFENIDVKYDIISNSTETEPSAVSLKVNLKDSFHMLAVPYIKYDSNKGTVVKLKIKDTNFLGTMNPLSSDINFSIAQEDEFDTPDFQMGLTFKYDYPFKAGPFNAEWTNSDELSYTFGDSTPEWDLNTGVVFTLPFDKISYKLAFNQAFIHNFDYSVYEDEYYFNEDVKFSVPVTLIHIDNFDDITYEPYLEFSMNWDTNEISKSNSDLSSPNVTIGHLIQTGRINWRNNYRNGVDFEIINAFSYNIQRQMWYPYVSAEIKAFKGFKFFDASYLNRIGICSDLYAFAYLMDNGENPYLAHDGEKIGSRLRGIRDEQVYSTMTNAYACKVPAAICFSFDLPYRLFETNFTKSFFKYLNFDLQISPFIDAALTYNKYTKKYFDPKDGFYTAGVEFLVFPKKLSSFTVRGSLGIDIGRKLFGDYINTSWRESDVSPFEIFVGVGLNY